LGNSHVIINKTFKGETPLAMSTRLGLQTVTIILLDNGAKPNTHDAFNAVICGKKDILDLFVNKSPQILHATNKQKQTLLHIAAEMGHSTVIRQLIDHNVQVEAKDFNNETALSIACKGRHMHALRIILHAWNQRGLQQDEIVVLRAVQNADIELLELLMEYNFDVNFVNREFGVPLHVAIHYGLREMLQFLLLKGANPNIKQDGHCPVHVAAAKDDIESLSVLKEYGADMFALTDTKDSIIHLAADKNHVHFIEFVLTLPECSSLIDLKNNNFDTALHIACKHGSAELTKLLLKFGFNTKLLNRSGYFPECLAEQQFKKLRLSTTVQKWAPYAECVKTLQYWHT
jgi:ankyrin repeat protein